MMNTDPTVSVVIPTRNRPQLVLRAVRSALSQTLSNLEVIVVIDGPDPATEQALGGVGDSRLSVVSLTSPVGGAESRNVGVRKGRAPWIAFLDDDDEWIAYKLERQLTEAQRSGHKYPIMACKLYARSPHGEFIWPRRLPEAEEPLSEYLLARRSVFQGEGLIQTSTLMVPRALLQKVPFRKIHRHHEWDWLLRVVNLPGVRVHVLDEPLSVWYVEERRTSISADLGWKDSLAWIQENTDLVTARAYAGFLMTVVSAVAARERHWPAFWLLLQEAVRRGKVSMLDIFLHVGMWCIPVETRRRFRGVLRRRSHG